MIINLFAGIITGFIVSIPPMGPIAFAMISKGFNNEVKEGKAIALGASFMDFFYCLIAFGGISLIISYLPSSFSEFYSNNTHWIEIILTFAGCFVVIIYGLKTMRSKITFSSLEAEKTMIYNNALAKANRLGDKAKIVANRLKVPEINNSNYFGLFFMGVLLCLSSITLPASWIALIGFLKGFNFLDATFPGGFLFSAGAFIGTFVWFYLLMKLITGNKKRINRETLNKLNIIAGAVLLLLGVFLFVKAVLNVFDVL